MHQGKSCEIRSRKVSDLIKNLAWKKTSKLNFGMEIFIDFGTDHRQEFVHFKWPRLGEIQ